MPRPRLAIILLVLTGFASSTRAGLLISRGKPVRTSTGVSGAALVNGKFVGNGKASSAHPLSKDAWVAIQVGAGPKRVFIDWNNPVDAWSNELSVVCAKSNPMLADYAISTSGNSTNGQDGNWTVRETVRGNIVTARGHRIAFDGASWVKITALSGASAGFGTLDEIEVFDITDGSDIVFFAGTSITQATFKENVVVPNVADQLSSRTPGRDWGIVRGGIGCIRSDNLAGTSLRKYLAAARSVDVWAIEMGTNDGWGGSNANVGTYTRNLQEMIDSCKAEGITPVISRPLATNPSAMASGSQWQLHADFAKAVDDLTSKNKLPKGPDFYTWFKDHPSELKSDGVHPNATGAASIQRLWAVALSALPSTGVAPSNFRPVASRLEIMVHQAGLDARADLSGILLVRSLDGAVLVRRMLGQGSLLHLPLRPGVALLSFASAQGVETRTILVP